MNKSLLLFKWLFLPYIFTVFLASFLGREKVDMIMGNNIKEEYIIVMFFLIIIDVQRIIIKWLQK